MKTEMSIHRALAELKLLDSRISKSITSQFILANKATNKLIAGKTMDEVKKTVVGNLDSVKQLIKNRSDIKKLVVTSNANTYVQIAGKTYSVAEAIDRKNSIHYEKDLLNVMKQQFTQANNAVEKENAQLPTKLETYLQSVLGEKGSRSPEDISAHTKVFNDNNRWELVDPNKVQDVIQTMEKDISEFEMQVDYTLSESNAVTKVTVEM